MTILEIRRHSHRKATGGSQLSQDGVDLARRVGDSMGPFMTVATSVVPRARETAIAMGFAVDVEMVTLASDEQVYREGEESSWWKAEAPFSALAEVLAREGAYHRYAHAMAAIWRDLMTPLPPDGQALVVGHSGELEAALVACLPGAAHETWGGTFGACEGARLFFEGDLPRFTGLEMIRF